MSYLIVLREEAHCLGVAATSLVISSCLSCISCSLPVFKCRMRFLGFAFLLLACRAMLASCSKVACHKGVILLSFLKSCCNNRRDKQVRHCTTSSRQLRCLPDHQPLYGRTRVGPPTLKRIYYFLLNRYCEVLEERGVVIKWEPCLALLMHLLPFTVSYGSWHLSCSGLDGLTKE